MLAQNCREKKEKETNRSGFKYFERGSHKLKDGVDHKYTQKYCFDLSKRRKHEENIFFL